MYEIKIIDAGHHYSLPELDGECCSNRSLIFVKRCDLQHPEKYPGNFNSYPGTTLQAVIRVLIMRLQYLQNQIPCWNNRLIIRLLYFSIWLLEIRAAWRHKRWYFHLPKTSATSFMCDKCGHTFCNH